MSHKAKLAEFVDQEYPITVTARHIHISQAMKDYVIEKLLKIEKFSFRIIDVAVTMDSQKIENRVAIVLKVNNVKLKSQASTTDMYVSIDQAVDKMEKQLQRYKQKLHDHQLHPIPNGEKPEEVVMEQESEALKEFNFEIELENEKALIDKYLSD